MSGRARDGRLVHFRAGDGPVRPGDIVTVEVTDAAPHHLIADGGILAHRRTRAGDAHADGQTVRGIGLGMPGIGRPVVPVAAEATSCGSAGGCGSADGAGSSAGDPQ